jgi:Fe-S cluster assembly scaffold protein SufB
MPEQQLPFCTFCRQKNVKSTVHEDAHGIVFRFDVQKDGYFEAKFYPQQNASIIIELILSEHAKGDVKIYHHGTGHSTFHCQTLQHHIGHQSESMVEVKFVGEVDARMEYRGKIEIPEGIMGAKITQNNKNLVFSEGVCIHTEPAMDIRSKDVECHHGAAIGDGIDAEMLQYFLLLGIVYSTAKDLFIAGFLNG